MEEGPSSGDLIPPGSSASSSNQDNPPLLPGSASAFSGQNTPLLPGSASAFSGQNTPLLPGSASAASGQTQGGDKEWTPSAEPEECLDGRSGGGGGAECAAGVTGGKQSEEDEELDAFFPGASATLPSAAYLKGKELKPEEVEELAAFLTCGGSADLPAAEHLFSDGSDIEGADSAGEFTDYENDEMVQYQAAVVALLEDTERSCWVCFASDEDDPTAAWVHPCRCSGTTKWVHQVCIQRWVDEKQKGNNTAGVSCPQCGTDYIIQFPAAGPIMRVVDAGDLLVGRLCPVIAGGVCVGSLYWTCVTFGAVTVMQVAGHDKGLLLIESADPLLLLVSLPLVPLGLVLGKMIKWQEPIIKVMRLYLPRLPLTPYLLPAFSTEPLREGSGAAANLPPSPDPVSVTRTFCGALFFPTIATFLGSTLFQQTESPLRRAALGGLTFVAVKGIIKIYHKQHLYIRQCKRVILDYP